MLNITFVWRDGRRETIKVEPDVSLMVAAVTKGIDGIEAECGGGMVCGTCHVHVDEPWLSRVGPPSRGENEILDGVPNVCAKSRLACQVNMTSALDGLIVTIPRMETATCNENL